MIFRINGQSVEMPAANATGDRDEHRRAAITCADAARRGVFPAAELVDCLRMLGIHPGEVAR